MQELSNTFQNITVEILALIWIASLQISLIIKLFPNPGQNKKNNVPPAASMSGIRFR